MPEHPLRPLSRAFWILPRGRGVEHLAPVPGLFTLVDLCRADAILASGVGFAVSALPNYGLNYRLAFHSGRPHRSALPRFATVAARRAPDGAH